MLNQLFGLLKERLILGDNPKVHKTSCACGNLCTHLVVHACAYGACMCIWCIVHLKSEKYMKSTPQK